MKLFKITIIIIFFALNFINAEEYLKVKPLDGDGLKTLFNRYKLEYNDASLSQFIDLNKSNIGKNNSLFLGIDYYLPIKVYKYNGVSIRSTINNSDYNYALSIQNYNDLLFSKDIKPNNFRIDKELWVPLTEFYFGKQKSISDSNLKSIDNSNELKTYDFNLLGEKYKTIKEVSHKLKGYVYYLVGGHGGPDPGAIGYRNGNTLSEDEYAYDIVLRLAKNLLENGATVKLIVQDPNDGIRDDYYLNNSYNEIYYGNEEIPLNQLERLRKRVEIINKEYEKNRKWAKEQIVVPIHVDSRENKNSRIDVFFYYYQHSERGKYIATSLLNTFEAKYEAAQPGRGYNGSVTTRGLYMLRNCKPVTVYMELGNIQNERDQIRLVEKNNRQAIANWLSDGFLKLVD